MKQQFRVFFLMLIMTPTLTLNAQVSLNKYKYIIIPEQYEFQKEKNSFRINELTKFLFHKEGFITLMSSDEYPLDLAANRCLGLTARLQDNSGVFTTKVHYELVNCRNKIVYTSNEGASKNKEYKKAYHEAIRESFKSISVLGYHYISESERVAVVKKQEELKQSETAIPVETYYAKAIDNGFELLDENKKEKYTITKTASKEIFTIGLSGVLFKRDDKWILSLLVEGNNDTIPEEKEVIIIWP